MNAGDCEGNMGGEHEKSLKRNGYRQNEFTVFLATVSSKYIKDSDTRWFVAGNFETVLFLTYLGTCHNKVELE